MNVSYATDSMTPIVTLDSGFPADAVEPVLSPFLTFNAWNPDAPQAQANQRAARAAVGGRGDWLHGLPWDEFNVFNEPHYAQPNATVDLLQAGRITAIVGTMREMQLGVKFLF